jgi:hypothetical protein
MPVKQNFLFLTFFISCFNLCCFAQTTYTWKNNNTGSWSTSGRWEPAGGPPGPGDNVIIDKGTVNLDVSIDELNMLGSLSVTSTGGTTGTLNLQGMTLSTQTLSVSGIGAINIDDVGGVNAELHVTGNLSLSGGIINLWEGIGPDGNILSVGGDISWTGGTFSVNESLSRMVIDGTAAQTITGAITVNTLVINNSGGSQITLNNALTISNQMIFTNGVVVPGMSGSVTFSSGASSIISNTPSSSFVDGPVSKVGTEGFIFPVGDNGHYAPIEISPPSSSVTFTAQYFHSDPDNVGADIKLDMTDEGSGVTLQKISDVEYWTLDGPADPVTVGLSYEANGRSGGIVSESDLRIVRWNPFVEEWTNLGPLSGGSGGQIEVNNINVFGTFTLGTVDLINTLPIELLHFTATPEEGGKVRLDWATATEVDNAGFMVERSGDGDAFEPVEEVPGDGRDSYETKPYRVYDENPLPGISYYRLKQMDYDGTVTYSPVRSVSMDAPASSGLQVFPNPARGRVTLLSVSELTGAELRLYNLNGREVAAPYSIRDFQLDLQVGALPAGVYFLKVTRDGETLTRRLVID